MTCQCGFRLNMPGKKCGCDEEKKQCEPGCKYPWCEDGGMCKIDYEKIVKENQPKK